mgnify:FL=1
MIKTVFFFLMLSFFMFNLTMVFGESYPSLTATIKTDKGDINLRLFPDKAPLTVLNFVNLSTRNFYNNLTFHRVIPNFMIQ